jgi:hypothetical protein
MVRSTHRVVADILVCFDDDVVALAGEYDDVVRPVGTMGTRSLATTRKSWLLMLNFGHPI